MNKFGKSKNHRFWLFPNSSKNWWMKTKCPPKNEMPFLLLDEKICFITLPLDTLQVVTIACGVCISAVLVMFATFLWFINQGKSWAEFFLPFYHEEIVAYMEVPILMCSPLVRNTLM